MVIAQLCMLITDLRILFYYEDEYTCESDFKTHNIEKNSYGCTISIYVKISQIEKLIDNNSFM